MGELEKEYVYAELTYPKAIADKLLPQIRARLYAYMEYSAFMLNNNRFPVEIEEFIKPVIIEYFQKIFVPFYGTDVPKDSKKFTELRKLYTNYQKANGKSHSDSSNPLSHLQNIEQ